MSNTFDEFYEELWNLDQQNNGATASARSINGGWINPDADILVDEQYEAAGKNMDVAPNPLFYAVNEEILKKETYESFIKLLNNYLIHPNNSEEYNDEEITEINKFLNCISKTNVAEWALAFLNENLDNDSIKQILDFIKSPNKNKLDKSDFINLIRVIWFDIYTNYFDKKATPNCSGFEHVFVGEGKESNDGIGGYHNWIKYYFDENGGRVDFKGYNYDNNYSEEGTENPYVATIQFTWYIKDIFGNKVERKFKDKGGFFVGLSPECQIIMGTVLYIESIAGLFTGTNRNVEINGEKYRLVLYRETVNNPNDGMRIRSFFPIYLYPSNKLDDTSNYEVMINEGNIKILTAYLHPRRSDRGRGWIEVYNNSAEVISLNNWKIVDSHGKEVNLEGLIEPNKTRRIMLYKDISMGKSGSIEINDANSKTVFKMKYRDLDKGKKISVSQKIN